MSRLQKVTGHAQLLLDAFLGLRLNYGLLKPLVADPDEHLALPSRGQLHTGISAIRTTLFFACVLDVVKLAWDEDDRTPSLVNLVGALRDPALLKQLRELHGDSVLTSRQPDDAG